MVTPHGVIDRHPKNQRRLLQRYLVLIGAVIGLVVFCVHRCGAQENESALVRSGSLLVAIDPTTGAVQKLEDLANELSWHVNGARIWQVDQAGHGLQAKLSVEASHAGEAAITLSLHNPSTQTIETDVRFPYLENLEGGDAASLEYCFPRQGLVLGSKPISLDQEYSSRFPLQFVTAYQPGKGGVYLMTCDTDLHRKRYTLEKNESLSMGATYDDLVIEPGQTISLPQARMGVYTGDWHQAFDAYRRWTKQWYQPTVPRKQWFREVFHFRQVFLYPNLDTPGLFDPSAKSLSIASSVEQDSKQFGGIDYVHLFDWSQTPDQGRVGMYDPWHHLPLQALNQEIVTLQDAGMPVGLYFEGYLVSPAAKIQGRPDRSWQLMNKQGGRYERFGSGYDYMCPAVTGWRDYLTATVKRVEDETKANGFYIDQLGFGYQYPCYDASHGHAVPSNQPKAEAQLVHRIRSALSEEDILYTEQTPVDIAMPYQDGSFSYSLLHARNPDSPSRINLTRFAFPDFKTIQILKGDGPIGDDVEGVKLVFYNGDGLWLVGPSDNPKWFSSEVLDTLRKTQAIRKDYLDAFTAEDVAPLVPTLVEGVYANRFRSERHTVWTLYNSTDEPVSGAVLSVPHREGAKYFDAWNQAKLVPDIREGWATLSVDIESREVSCIVMSRSSVSH